MTQRPDDEPVPPGEPPVYGTPDPEGPPPPPPPPPPGYAAPGYGPTPPVHPPAPGYPPPPGPSSYQQPPPAPPGWGGPPPPPSYSQWGHPAGEPARGPLSGGVQEERQWALFAHLGGVLAYFPVVHLLPALAIYSVFANRSEFVRQQAREALNFQIFVLIAYFVARILNALPLFPNLVVFVWLFSLVFSVLAAVAVSRGERYRYPLTYRFLK